MEKIVILSGPAEGDEMLIACLRVLFPEYEIRVRSKRLESSGDLLVAPEPSVADKGGERNGKHLNCR